MLSRYDQHIFTILQLAPENSQKQLADICQITRNQVAEIARSYYKKHGDRIPFKGSRDWNKPTYHELYIDEIIRLARHSTIKEIELELGISRGAITSAIKSEERINGNVVRCKKGPTKGPRRKIDQVFIVGGGLLNRGW